MNQLTFTEEEVWKRFEAWLNLHQKKTFSSDYLRNYGLHTLLRDPAHEVGAIFQTKILQGVIVEVGRTRSQIPSNHGREIRLYKFAT